MQLSLFNRAAVVKTALTYTPGLASLIFNSPGAIQIAPLSAVQLFTH